MTIKVVTKRDGTKQEFDISKIKRCTKWATQGLKANPLELEAKLSITLNDEVATKSIHAQCIDASLKLVSLEAPDWRYVAGRLFYMQLFKEVQTKRLENNTSSFSLWNNLQSRIEQGWYEASFFSTYSKNEINLAQTYLVPERNLDFDYAGMTSLASRYLLADELPQEMFLILSLCLCKDVEVDRMDKVKQVYDALSLRQLSLATPIMMNLRKKNGNLSSCFITAMGDSAESILKGIHDTAIISKEGGGVGVNVSSIRAAGAEIRRVPNASGGVVPFIKILNDTALAFNQGKLICPIS